MYHQQPFQANVNWSWDLASQGMLEINVSEVQGNMQLFCHLASVVSSRGQFWLWYGEWEARVCLGFYTPRSFSIVIQFPHLGSCCGVSLHLLTQEGLSESGSHCSGMRQSVAGLYVLLLATQVLAAWIWWGFQSGCWLSVGYICLPKGPKAWWATSILGEELYAASSGEMMTHSWDCLLSHIYSLVVHSFIPLEAHKHWLWLSDSFLTRDSNATKISPHFLSSNLEKLSDCFFFICILYCLL